MQFTDFKNDGDITTFTFQGHLFAANALRRTIINDINTWVFMTSPNEHNQATFHANTTRLNNELLKQRLSCIPIHVKYGTEEDLTEYYLEVNAENKSDTIEHVTTKHFVVRHKETHELANDLRDKMFPSFDSGDGDYYILFITLRPQISNEIPGEKIHFTCNFSVGNVRTSSMFNAVSNCSFGNTVDYDQCEIILEKKREEWLIANEDVAREEANWRLLEGKRIFKPESFDFTLETIGVFTNQEILFRACGHLVDLLKDIAKLFERDDVSISLVRSQSTIQNSWNIIFVDDYTIGKLLEYSFNKLETSYCGYVKLHPHDETSTLRVAFKTHVERDEVLQMLILSIEENIKLFVDLGNSFSRNV